MGIFSNITNRFNDDDYDDDDDELNEYDDDYEDQPSRSRSIFGRRKQDDDEYEEQNFRSNTRSSGKGTGGNGRTSSQQMANPRTGSRTNYPPAVQKSKMQVRIIQPSSFDQARQIGDTLLAHRTVLLNLEGLDVNTAQRIVDFASGSCYALHGNFMKISHFIIVITPEDVDIAGDIASAAGQGQDAGAAFSGNNQNQGTMNGSTNDGSMGSYMNNTGMNGMNGMNNSGYWNS